MLSHNQVKYINSLKIKKFRQKHHAFIVEGEKGVSELLDSSIKLISIFATAGWIERNHTKLGGMPFELQEITTAELNKISDLVTPNQVMALAEMPETNLLAPADLINGMTLALDGIRDPGNMGTMIRTADWFGIKRIICSPDSVDVYNPKVVQATMGSFSRMSVFYLNLPDFFKSLHPDIPVYGALLEAPDITNQTFSRPGIVLIGSESHGISGNLQPYINTPLHIPHFYNSNAENSAESLNASVSNGIICYEICKQLHKNNF